MSTFIGSPPIFPDGVLLDQNSSSGNLELKAGTQGDILIATAAGVWTKLSASNGNFLKSLGNAADPAWTAVVQGNRALLQTLSPAGVATITTAALTAYPMYFVEIEGLTLAASDWFGLQFNGDSGGNYGYCGFNSTGITNATAQAQIKLFTVTAAVNGTSLFLIITGKTPAVASGQLGVAAQVALPISTSTHNLASYWVGGNNTQISTITFKSGVQNFTGTIRVYGVSGT